MTFAGDVFFWILVAMALAAVVVFLGRFLELHRAQINCQDFVKGIANILSRDNDEEALAICEDTPAPVAEVVAAAVRSRHSSPLVLRETVDAQGRATVGRLDRRLASLAIIAQVAPSVGLIGTLVGFVRTVQLVNATELVSRPELLSAAMTTLVLAVIGLAVGVMASVMYGLLRVRMDRIVIELESAASQIVGSILRLVEGQA